MLQTRSFWPRELDRVELMSVLRKSAFVTQQQEDLIYIIMKDSVCLASLSYISHRRGDTQYLEVKLFSYIDHR